MTSNFEAGVEDVGAAVAAGRAVRDHGPYGIEIADETLRFVPKVVQDPVITGNQVLAVMQLRPASDYLVFQMLRDGALEEIRPEEGVDLREAGVEKFLVFRSDRSFRFYIDERAFDWGAAHISGNTLKRLGNLPVIGTDLWLDIVGSEDQLVGDRDLIDLSRPGVERFNARPTRIVIKVNSRDREVDHYEVDYWEIVRLAFPNAAASPQTIYTIDYAAGPRQNPNGSMVEGQKVLIKNGMKFYVTQTDKS